MIKKEEQLHLSIARYLKYQYPGIIFRTDFAAGIKMNIGQAVRHKAMQSGAGFPDLFIAEPRGGYHGLFIEIKKDISQVLKKNGQFVSNQHIREQAEMLRRLSEKGYKAVFGCGFEHCIRIIDDYFKLS